MPTTFLHSGYADEDKSCVFELTYNWGVESYSKGNAYAQVAISTKVKALMRNGRSCIDVTGPSVRGGLCIVQVLPLPLPFPFLVSLRALHPFCCAPFSALHRMFTRLRSRSRRRAARSRGNRGRCRVRPGGGMLWAGVGNP